MTKLYMPKLSSFSGNLVTSEQEVTFIGYLLATGMVAPGDIICSHIWHIQVNPTLG